MIPNDNDAFNPIPGNRRWSAIAGPYRGSGDEYAGAKVYGTESSTGSGSGLRWGGGTKNGDGRGFPSSSPKSARNYGGGKSCHADLLSSVTDNNTGKPQQ